MKIKQISILILFIFIISCIELAVSDNSDNHKYVDDAGDAQLGEDAHFDFDASVIDDQNVKDSSLIDINYCPGWCLMYAAIFDCRLRFEECVNEWNDSLTQYCAEDSKYCNLEKWTLGCLTDQYACWSGCTQLCMNCSDRYGCNIPSYECKEYCEQEIDF